MQPIILVVGLLGRNWVMLKRWVLVDLNRYALAVGIAALGFGAFAVLEVTTTLVVTRDTVPMLYLFSALAGGNITLITIVVTINQLILSRELRSPRELETEMHAASEFRNEVEAETDTPVVPERPGEFLEVLVEATRQATGTLDDLGDDLADADVQSAIEALTLRLASELDTTADRLAASENGVFPALSTILDANFATHINRSRWIKETHADVLSEQTETAFTELEQRLEQLDVARQYFKTIYIKQELADLSNGVMATGLVAVIVALTFIAWLGNLSGSDSSWASPFLLPTGVMVTLFPLALLISHVFRIATIARRTAAITPFLAPSQ